MQNVINAYQTSTKMSGNPQNTEATLLINAAEKLALARDMLPDEKNLEEALTYNRKLWMVFVSSLSRDDNPMEKNIRKNLISLGAFIFKQSLAILSNPQKDSIDNIISINRNVAQGLKGNA